MARRLGIVVCVALAAVVFAPSAGASTLTEGTTSVGFNAAAAEPNNLTITEEGSNLVFTDVVPIMPTMPCLPVTAVKATCPAGSVINITVNLGDLNDTATVADSVSLPANGGATISGEAGADTITGGRFVRNFLSGASFADTVGDDTLTGGDLTDTFDGGSGNDTMTGGSGADQFTGGPGNDVASGGADSDTFRMGTAADGADVIDGGTGNDAVDYSLRRNAMSVSLNGVADDGEGCPGPACEGDNLIDISSVDTGFGDDTIAGGDADEVLEGNDGNDTISGGAGVDTLLGDAGADSLAGGDGVDSIRAGAGNDTADGGAGDDVFVDAGSAASRPIARRGFTPNGSDHYIGGPGEDQISYEFAPAAVAVSLDDVANDGTGCPGAACEQDNVGADVEDILGTPLADTFVGNEGANQFDGERGSDVIAGGGGPDTVIGGDGNDTLDAGPGNDSLRGDAGSDLLRTRDGDRDQVDCGSSADRVIADAADEPEPSCEDVSDGIVIGPSAKASTKKVSLELGCPAAEGIDCELQAKLVAKGKTIAKGKATIASGQTEKVALKLNDDGVRALNGPGKLHALASVSFVDATGATLVTKAKVVVG